MIIKAYVFYQRIIYPTLQPSKTPGAAYRPGKKEDQSLYTVECHDTKGKWVEEEEGGGRKQTRGWVFSYKF